MWFDADAALARIQSEYPEDDAAHDTPATPATRAGKSGPHVADVAAPTGENAKFESGPSVHSIEPAQPPNVGPAPTRFGVGGRPVTWAGKVVSLDDWRNLTEWERHGPNGRMWDGNKQEWVSDGS